MSQNTNPERPEVTVGGAFDGIYASTVKVIDELEALRAAKHGTNSTNNKIPGDVFSFMWSKNATGYPSTTSLVVHANDRTHLLVKSYPHDRIYRDKKQETTRRGVIGFRGHELKGDYQLEDNGGGIIVCRLAGIAIGECQKNQTTQANLARDTRFKDLSLSDGGLFTLVSRGILGNLEAIQKIREGHDPTSVLSARAE